MTQGDPSGPKIQSSQTDSFRSGSASPSSGTLVKMEYSASRRSRLLDMTASASACSIGPAHPGGLRRSSFIDGGRGSPRTVRPTVMCGRKGRSSGTIPRFSSSSTNDRWSWSILLSMSSTPTQITRGLSGLGNARNGETFQSNAGAVVPTSAAARQTWTTSSEARSPRKTSVTCQRTAGVQRTESPARSTADRRYCSIRRFTSREIPTARKVRIPAKVFAPIS
jgi:hypothetical protein